MTSARPSTAIQHTPRLALTLIGVHWRTIIRWLKRVVHDGAKKTVIGITNTKFSLRLSSSDKGCGRITVNNDSQRKNVWWKFENKSDSILNFKDILRKQKRLRRLDLRLHGFLVKAADLENGHSVVANILILFLFVHSCQRVYKITPPPCSDYAFLVLFPTVWTRVLRWTHNWINLLKNSTPFHSWTSERRTSIISTARLFPTLRSSRTLLSLDITSCLHFPPTQTQRMRCSLQRKLLCFETDARSYAFHQYFWRHVSLLQRKHWLRPDVCGHAHQVIYLRPMFPLVCAKVKFDQTICAVNPILAHVRHAYLISSIYRIAFLPLETFHWLCVYMVTQLHAHLNIAQCKIFLEETLIGSVFVKFS